MSLANQPAIEKRLTIDFAKLSRSCNIQIAQPVKQSVSQLVLVLLLERGKKSLNRFALAFIFPERLLLLLQDDSAALERPCNKLTRTLQRFWFSREGNEVDSCVILLYSQNYRAMNF